MLGASQTLFLWMFLAADPLEQVAAAAPSGAAPGPDPSSALEFAARWRHGMAGNSGLHMPGFLATAASVWLHARGRSGRRAAAENLLCGLAALLIAAVLAPFGARLLAADYAAVTAGRIPEALPPPSWVSAVLGSYTLLTWTVFVLCARAAVVRRTIVPFGFPALLTAILAVVRPWTVGDFTAHWARGVASAEPVAVGSLAVAVALAAVLPWLEIRRPH